MSKTQPVCFQLDNLNLDTIDEMAEEVGLKRRIFLRFKAIEMAKEHREKKLKS